MRFVPEGGLPEGYSWKLHEGGDFDVYYAEPPSNRNAGVSIYLGNWPNFPYTGDLPRKEGQVLGNRISWIVLDDSKETEYTFHRTTLLRYQHSVYHPIYVHISVFAEEEDELQLILRNLENLRIKPMVGIFQLIIQRLSRS